MGRLPGVAGITYLGQRDYSLRAWLDPDKLAALKLSAMDVVTAISQQNIQVAAGQIGQQPAPKGQQFQLTINTLGRLTDPDQFANIIIKAGTQGNVPATSRRIERQREQHGLRAGQPRRAAPTSLGGPAPPSTGIVYLKDVVTRTPPPEDKPRVELGSQQYDQSCTLDGQPSVALSIYQLPGSNALDTADNVYDKMKELKTRFPDGLDYQDRLRHDALHQRIGERSRLHAARSP